MMFAIVIVINNLYNCTHYKSVDAQSLQVDAEE